MTEELRELLYCVDSMCECYRNRNFGEAEEWIRHLDKAYSDYQQEKEDVGKG